MSGKLSYKKQPTAGLGIHTSITPSILAGLEYAYALGATAAQIFTGSNMTASLKSKHKLTPDEIAQILDFRRNTGMQLVIHAVYVLNFCAWPPSSGRIQFAHANLRWDLTQAQNLGGGIVVLHIGNKMALSREEAYQNMAANVRHILYWMSKNTPDVTLCLETPAGQGTQIATNIDDLAELWQMSINSADGHHFPAKIYRQHLGICIDTAHIFASGVDIRTPKGLKDYLSEFDRLIGLQFLRSIHLNDNKQPFGSRKDQHDGLADGYIYRDDRCMSVVRELVGFAKSRQIPIILETHRAGSAANPDGELYAQEIGLLQQFRDGNTKAGCDWRLTHKSGQGSKSGKGSRSANSARTLKYKTLKQSAKFAGAIGLNNPANLGLLNKLRDLKEYYTLVEPDKIRALAYGRAWLTIKNYPEEIMNGQQIAHLCGIGAKMVIKVDEYIKDGEMQIFKKLHVSSKLANARETALHDVSAVLGIGPTRALALHRQGIHTTDDLKQAIESGKVKLNDLEQLGLLHHLDLIKKIPRTEAEAMLREFTRIYGTEFKKKWRPEFELAGSYPSGRLESKDIDILVFTPLIQDIKDLKLHGNELTKELSELMTSSGLQVGLYARGESKLLSLLRLDSMHPVRHVDIRLIPMESMVFGRMYFTSGRDFNQILRLAAKKRGLKLNEFGLYRGATAIPNLATEEDIMSAIGVPFVPMAKRR
jgi:deoxyribonuclease-4